MSDVNGAAATASIEKKPNNSNRRNLFCAEPGALRPVVIDGSNVAMQMGGQQKIFQTRGILICARYFISRGHQVIVFVPQFRATQREDNFRRPMKDQHLLNWMRDNHMLVYTPSRRVTLEDNRSQRIVCYDDFYIVQYAHETGGVIVSKDQYRDVMREHPEWVDTIQTRLIMFSWVGEMFMVAEDPCGRRGPRLPEVLRYKEGENVAPFGMGMSNETRDELVRKIDEVLAAPPPPPSPPLSVAENGASSSSLEFQERTSIADMVALSVAPRYGFTRRDNNFGFNHRNRRWMSEQGTLLAQWPTQAVVDREQNSLPSVASDPDLPLEQEQDSSPSPPSLEVSNATEIDRGLFEHFCGIFPTQIVEKVLKEYKDIRNLELLANLLADALIRQ